MGTILRPDTPVTVEYDSAKGRASKTLPDAYAARRFWLHKDKRGKNPKVVAPGTAPASARSKSVAVYVRVSTVGQNEAGQRAEIEKWLSGNGIDAANVVWFIDHGKSGDNLHRPAFERLQASIFVGEVSTVVVYKLDRLSRDLRDGINVLCDWCDRGLRVVSVTQQIDFNGALGKMLAAVLLGIAEMEQQTRRERQAAGIAAIVSDPKLRAEKYKGRPAGSTKAKPARARRLRDKGLTILEIASAMRVSRDTVQRYLKMTRVETVESA